MRPTRPDGTRRRGSLLQSDAILHALGRVGVLPSQIWQPRRSGFSTAGRFRQARWSSWCISAGWCARRSCRCPRRRRASTRRRSSSRWSTGTSGSRASPHLPHLDARAALYTHPTVVLTATLTMPDHADVYTDYAHSADCTRCADHTCRTSHTDCNMLAQLRGRIRHVGGGASEEAPAAAVLHTVSSLVTGRSMGMRRTHTAPCLFHVIRTTTRGHSSCLPF